MKFSQQFPSLLLQHSTVLIRQSIYEFVKYFQGIMTNLLHYIAFIAVNIHDYYICLSLLVKNIDF